MATVDEVARGALAALNSNAGLLIAIRWASERYRQIANQTKMRHLRRVGELVIPADVTAGTVSATRDSNVVTGDATAAAAWASDLVGRYFRARRNWYKIGAVSGTSMTLVSPYTEDDVTATTYHVVSQRSRLAPDARFLGRFVHMRLHRPLVTLGQDQVDFEHPSREIIAGSGPEIVCEAGEDEDGVKLVELYPYCTQQEMIRYTYWPASPELRPGSHLPDDLDPAILRDGVLIDVMRFEMAKALRANQVEVAATWRNEARAQEAAWTNRVAEAIKADRGLDDVSVILHTRGQPVAYRDGDPFIRTAREDALSRLTNWP